MSTAPKIALLIMAAGGSSRMGNPKQLLPWKDSSLLESTISTALEVKNTSVGVVLGARHEEIRPLIEHLEVNLIYNKNWAKGLGGSIAEGVKSLQKAGDFDAILILLADQPFITSKDLEIIIAKYKTNYKTIIATKYENDKLGVPVLFDRFYFRQLMKLDGDKGANLVITKNLRHVIPVKLHHAHTDIDTKADYQKALNKTRN